MHETFVAGEEGVVSSSVVPPSEIEITLERRTFEAGDFCPRTLFGVEGIERESKFGAVFDL